MNRWFSALLLLLCVLSAARADQGSPDPGAGSGPDWAIHLDETLIGQYHGRFPSARANGPNSFSNLPERSDSSITGLELGADLGNGTEAWTRFESIRGIPLSNAGGLAALTNNDMQRVMTNHFSSYLALAYLSKTWDLGGTAQDIDPGDYGFPHTLGSHRINLIAGKVDVLSIFDGNTYAHKGDDQFLNWCFMASCAYDFAADARGYTWGAGSQMTWDDWTARAGWFAMPILPNQLTMDTSVGHHFGLNGELERRWEGGALRLLLYQGRMRLANYNAYAQQTGVYIQSAAKTDARRGGGGINFEQALFPGVGLFGRAFWTRSNNETMAFTEADRSLSTGLSFDGKLWHRSLDGIGVGLIENQISAARAQFLANGNYDLFIGDGYLSYAPEQAFETYYRFGIIPGIHFTLDYQRIVNPAYNALRGPIDVYGVRLHLEF